MRSCAWFVTSAPERTALWCQSDTDPKWSWHTANQKEQDFLQHVEARTYSNISSSKSIYMDLQTIICIVIVPSIHTETIQLHWKRMSSLFSPAGVLITFGLPGKTMAVGLNLRHRRKFWLQLKELFAMLDLSDLISQSARQQLCTSSNILT